MNIGRQLVEHMAKGFSFRTFAAESGVPYSTLCDWAEKNENFKKFKAVAEAKSQLYWETIGIAASQGNLRKVTKETVKRTTLLDSEGKPVLKENGTAEIQEQVVERTYEPIPLQNSMWIFVMKSRFGYRDDGQDAFNPDNPAQSGTKTFQLSYNLTDQAYVVKSKASEPPTQGAKDEPAAATSPAQPNGSDPKPVGGAS